MDELAAVIRAALADPSVRAELLALLGGDDAERRARRLAELEQELAGMELTLKMGDGDGP